MDEAEITNQPKALQIPNSDFHWHLLSAITEAQKKFLSHPVAFSAFEVLLRLAINLTGSAYGFIGEVHTGQSKNSCLSVRASGAPDWDEEQWDQVRSAPFEQCDPNTLLGLTLARCRTVISNDPANYPESWGIPPGHPELINYAAIPLFYEQDMIGILGLANRVGGFSGQLTKELEPFTSTCATLIHHRQNRMMHLAESAQLRISEGRLQSVLNNVIDAIITINEAGVIESVNPATKSMFEYEVDEMLGQNVKILMDQPYRDQHDGYLSNYMNTGTARIIGSGREVEARRKDGSHFPIDLSVSEVDLGAEKLFVGVIRDISERKQHEKVAKQAFEDHRDNLQLRQLAQTDSLTGIANRRHFDHTLDEEIRRAARENSAVSLLMIDIDYFKPYNDTYGHVLGDQCLEEVAAAINNTFERAGELSARYGGEEFAVILPGVDKHHAANRAETLRKNIEALGLPHESSLISNRVTVSVGCGTLNPNRDSVPEELISAADEALYQAKHAGRNRVEFGRE